MIFDPVHIVGTCLPRWVAWRYPDALWRMPDTERVAYLTFDDGPSIMSAPLLDVLARFKAPATFFLLGGHAEQDPGLVKAMVEGGHTFGNHSYSHLDAWKVPPRAFLDELDRTTRILEDLTQQPLLWMRPPYGHFTRAVRSWCQEKNQRLMMWDVGVGDYLPKSTPHLIERRLQRGIRPGSIIVLHDNVNASRITPMALAHVLEQLYDDGWRIGALE